MDNPQIKSPQPAWFGPARELLMYLAGLLVAFNVFPESAVDQIIGVVVAGTLLFWGIKSNAGIEQTLTLARKFLSLLPALLLYFGVINKDMAIQITGFIAPAIAMLWSFLGKRTVKAKEVS